MMFTQKNIVTAMILTLVFWVVTWYWGNDPFFSKKLMLSSSIYGVLIFLMIRPMDYMLKASINKIFGKQAEGKE